MKKISAFIMSLLLIVTSVAAPMPVRAEGSTPKEVSRIVVKLTKGDEPHYVSHLDLHLPDLKEWEEAGHVFQQDRYEGLINDGKMRLSNQVLEIEGEAVDAYLAGGEIPMFIEPITLDMLGETIVVDLVQERFDENMNPMEPLVQTEEAVFSNIVEHNKGNEGKDGQFNTVVYEVKLPADPEEPEVEYSEVVLPSAEYEDLNIGGIFADLHVELNVYKVDEETEKSLEGAEFKIEKINQDQEVVEDLGIYTTDENGILSVKVSYGDALKITEVKAPEGYEKLDSPIFYNTVDEIEFRELDENEEAAAQDRLALNDISDEVLDSFIMGDKVYVITSYSTGRLKEFNKLTSDIKYETSDGDVIRLSSVSSLKEFFEKNKELLDEKAYLDLDAVQQERVSVWSFDSEEFKAMTDSYNNHLKDLLNEHGLHNLDSVLGSSSLTQEDREHLQNYYDAVPFVLYQKTGSRPLVVEHGSPFAGMKNVIVGRIESDKTFRELLEEDSLQEFIDNAFDEGKKAYEEKGKTFEYSVREGAGIHESEFNGVVIKVAQYDRPSVKTISYDEAKQETVQDLTTVDKIIIGNKEKPELEHWTYDFKKPSVKRTDKKAGSYYFDFSHILNIHKIDSSDNEKSLSGAIFNIYKVDADGNELENLGRFTSRDDQPIKLDIKPNEIIKIEEVVSPEGYELLSDPVYYKASDFTTVRELTEEEKMKLVPVLKELGASEGGVDFNDKMKFIPEMIENDGEVISYRGNKNFWGDEEFVYDLWHEDSFESTRFVDAFVGRNKVYLILDDFSYGGNLTLNNQNVKNLPEGKVVNVAGDNANAFFRLVYDYETKTTLYSFDLDKLEDIEDNLEKYEVSSKRGVYNYERDVLVDLLDPENIQLAINKAYEDLDVELDLDSIESTYDDVFPFETMEEFFKEFEIEFMESTHYSIGNDKLPEKPVIPEEPEIEEPVVPEEPEIEDPVIPEEPEIEEPVIPEEPEIEDPVIPEEPEIEEPVVEVEDPVINIPEEKPKAPEKPSVEKEKVVKRIEPEGVSEVIKYREVTQTGVGLPAAGVGATWAQKAALGSIVVGLYFILKKRD